MLDESNVASYRGTTMIDKDGDKVGTVQEIYLDDYTGKPEWALVNTGLFGSKSTFVPLQGASGADEGLRVAWDKQTIKDAPNLDVDQHLSEDEERTLYQHYQLSYEDVRGDTTTGTETTGTGTGYAATDYTETTATTGRGDHTTDTTDTGAPSYDTSGPTTDDAMTLSEERVNVGTETREAGRARLRKYVTTEEVTQTVPVSREEVRIEREPITDANRAEAYSGADLSEEEHEVVLREEVPVVNKEVVATERVRLDTDRVQDETTVTEEARREEVTLDEDGRRRS
jgi:uncharacterized protein (TIGR02271 family)